MDTSIFSKIIAEALSLREGAVANTMTLLDEGATIPFIARYRKERTGGLDEVHIGQISEQYDKLKELAKRKETILKTIGEQGKLTPELQKQIEQTWNATELEDLYLPYKPRRRTRAQIAREQGLEPLAQIIMLQRERNIEAVARRYVNDDLIATPDDAIAGAKDIIAEMMSEDAQARQRLRNTFARDAMISSKVVKAKRDDEGAGKYRDYFDFSEPLRRCSGNRLLAMRRGENEGFLRVKLSVDDERAIERLQRQFVRGYGPCSDLVAEAGRRCLQAFAGAIDRNGDGGSGQSES